MRHEHLWKVYPGLGIAWPPCPVIVGCMFRNSITWHSRSADLTWGRETTCTNQHALLRKTSWQPESPTGPTGEVPRRHRHTTATPASEAPKNIAVQELLKDHEWSHDINMNSYDIPRWKRDEMIQTWWILVRPLPKRWCTSTKPNRQTTKFPKRYHDLWDFCLLAAGVWTQVLLQTRQPLQVDWGRPFSERDGSIYSSPIPPLSFRQNGTLFVLVSILKPGYTKPFRLMSWCLFYRLVACKPGPYLFPKKMSLETAPTSLQSRTSRYTQNHADMNWNALGIYIDMLDI